MSSGAVQGAVFKALKELGRVFGEDRVMNAAGQVLQTAAQTKSAVDDNVATVLAVAGLPSRSDIDGLRRQLDALQVSVANLSRKVDRLVEEQAKAHAEGHAGGPGHRRPRRPQTTFEPTPD